MARGDFTNSGLHSTPQCPLSRRSVLLGAAATGLTFAGTARRASANDFAGKSITLIVGFPPGGGVDNGARLIARHLPRFIPGNPAIIVQNMPGAGGATAGNFMFARAPADGLTLGVPGRDWPLVPVLDKRGAIYDPLAFEYIGSSGEVNTFVWISKRHNVATPAQWKALKTELVFGGLTPDTQPSLLPAILARNGYPVRAVSGYRGTAAIIAAIESGEVDGIATNASSFARRPDMVTATHRVFQLLKSVESIPLVHEHVDKESHALLQLAGYASATGMPLVAPPKTPPERVAILRAAFGQMARDKTFEAEAIKIGEPFGSPVDGTIIRQILSQTIKAATPQAIETFRALIAKGK